jgi:hypothetical protein
MLTARLIVVVWRILILMSSTAPLVVDLAQRITHLFDENGLTILERGTVLKVAKALILLSDATFDRAITPAAESPSPVDRLPP